MTDFRSLDPRKLEKHRSELMRRYRAFQSRNLDIDMTRGKPCPEQLDLALGMLDCVNSRDFQAEDGIDCRNYGGLDGLPEAKRLFAQYLEVEADEIVIGGNFGERFRQRKYGIFVITWMGASRWSRCVPPVTPLTRVAIPRQATSNGGNSTARCWAGTTTAITAVDQ